MVSRVIHDQGLRAHPPPRSQVVGWLSGPVPIRRKTLYRTVPCARSIFCNSPSAGCDTARPPRCPAWPCPFFPGKPETRFPGAGTDLMSCGTSGTVGVAGRAGPVFTIVRGRHRVGKLDGPVDRVANRPGEAPVISTVSPLACPVMASRDRGCLRGLQSVTVCQVARVVLWKSGC